MKSIINASNILSDAFRLNKENPETFELPLEEDYARIAVGGHVKVAIPGERFWVKVSAIHDDGTYEGVVDNDLFSDYAPPRADDHIRFEKRNIYSVY